MCPSLAFQSQPNYMKPQARTAEPRLVLSTPVTSCQQKHAFTSLEQSYQHEGSIVTLGTAAKLPVLGGVYVQYEAGPAGRNCRAC